MNHLTSLSSVEAESMTFFDPRARAYGFITPDLAMIFKDGRLLAYSDSAVIVEQRAATVWHGAMTAMKGSFDIEWTTETLITGLSSGEEQICSVSGTVTESGNSPEKIECGGTVSTREPNATPRPPKLRTVSAVFDLRTAITGHAYKPAVYHGHGDERIEAVLVEDQQTIALRDMRISTVYDDAGFQSQASMELWLPDDELPRRVTGEIIPGTHAQIAEWNVNTAFFAWRYGSKTGYGLYEITTSAPAPIAA